MSALHAVAFLPFTLAIGIWVAWSDMKTMKIPNLAALALFGVWLVLGMILMPWQVWAWGVALGAMVLVVGMFASAIGLFGGGDAKFIAAMTPFFTQADLRNIMLLSVAVMLSALVAHRAWRAIPALKATAPDWESFSHKDFPMGFALAGILNIYIGQHAAVLLAH